jgi:hypothetical protein
MFFNLSINVFPVIKPVREPYQQQRNADKVHQLPEIELVSRIKYIHIDKFKWAQVPYFCCTFSNL